MLIIECVLNLLNRKLDANFMVLNILMVLIVIKRHMSIFNG